MQIEIKTSYTKHKSGTLGDVNYLGKMKSLVWNNGYVCEKYLSAVYQFNKLTSFKNMNRPCAHLLIFEDLIET